jgi:glutathione S-transferase
MITLFQQQDSGNCYKVRLLLAHLDVPFRTVEVNSLSGETRSPAFLARNPAGQVPTVALEDGRHLAQSNAILLHFAEGSPYLPRNAFDRAKAYEWLFFEQYSHEPAIAVRRALSVYPERRANADPLRMAQLLEAGHKALAVMETRLAKARWLAGDSFSIADIALYAYTHAAAEGGFDLAAYPCILAWIAGVAAQPGHVTREHAFALA